MNASTNNAVFGSFTPKIMPCCLSLASMDAPEGWSVRDLAAVNRACYEADMLRHQGKKRGERLFDLVMNILINKPIGEALRSLLAIASWLAEAIALDQAVLSAPTRH